MSVRNGHRRRLAAAETIAEVMGVAVPAMPTAEEVDIDRLSPPERAELEAIFARGADEAAGVMVWDRVPVWDRFRAAQLYDRVAFERGYPGHRISEFGAPEIELAFRSVGTSTVGRRHRWFVYLLFPELGRPAALSPLDPQHAESVAHLEYRQRESLRIAREQGAWDLARQIEAEDRVKAALR